VSTVPKKELGQHFLADENILGVIGRLAELREDDVVPENGPGLGALTTYLAARVAHVHAVELDRSLEPRLREALGRAKGSVELHFGDALQLDLAALEPERLALLVNPRVLDLVGDRPAAPDWEPTERDRASAIWRRDGVVGVFNWDWEEREVVVPVNGRRRARDLWQDRDLGLVEGELRLQVPAAGARLVALAEA